MKLFILVLCLFGCGYEEALTPTNKTILIKDPSLGLQPGKVAPRGPVARPKPPSRDGVLSGGGIRARQPEPIPEAPSEKLPCDLWGEDDYYYNDSGRQWPWCDKIPEVLQKDFDEDWGWVPNSAEWCKKMGIYQLDDGCSCRRRERPRFSYEIRSRFTLR